MNTNKNYEKLYKEALERAREIKKKIMYSHLSTESCKAVSEYIDTIIPELAESEDERIRKRIYSIIYHNDALLDKEKLLTWLEKQKEQENTSVSTMIPSCHEELTEFELVLFNAVLDNNFVGAKGSENALAMTKKVAPELLAIARKEPGYKHEDYFCERCQANAFNAGRESVLKEQKPNYCHYGGDPNIERCRYCSATCSARLTEEQKPVEWSKKPHRFCDDTLEAIDKDREMREQHPELYPAEWSDTNELVFQDICKHLKEEGFGGWVVLLKALRNGEFNTPKQEWSEEDEKKWVRCCYGDEDFDVSIMVRNEDKDLYQLIFRFWDFEQFKDGAGYSVDFVVMPCIDERMDAVCSSMTNDLDNNVEFAEQFAKDYYEFVIKHIEK